MYILEGFNSVKRVLVAASSWAFEFGLFLELSIGIRSFLALRHWDVTRHLAESPAHTNLISAVVPEVREVAMHAVLTRLVAPTSILADLSQVPPSVPPVFAPHSFTTPGNPRNRWAHPPPPTCCHRLVCPIGRVSDPLPWGFVVFASRK